ncbi:hypothetical protein GCM10010300_11840 [Streptomyces olivaceoviridis]|nr:hypothetical protein GCM10010300_11840 [Streptomyces olivaceoviridis]
MASIHTPGVAAASRSRYSARPDTLDHPLYVIEHVLYSRRTPAGHRQEATKDGRSGILPDVRPSGAVRPQGTAEDAGTGTGVRATSADTLPGERSDTATTRGRGESDR